MKLIKNTLAHVHGRCDHAMRAVSDRLDAPLSLRKRSWLWLHLWTCAACERASRQMELTHRAIDRSTESKEKLSSESRERIRASLHG